MQQSAPEIATNFDVTEDQAGEKSHIHTHIKDPSRLKKILQLQAILKDTHQKRRPQDLINEIHRPIYDDIYEAWMEAMDEEGQIEDPVNISQN